MDFTGTGNTLNMTHPHVLQLIMDSLRYWVTEMHVDGFRFDLASTLARELFEVNRLGAFFDIIHQDPVLSQVKLIAEPWDVGPGGYQVGNFPVLWTEWNGKYRDCVRRFWKGDGGTTSELATRLAGSSDLYQDDGRKPYASINFITCHDGFTLHDLVSYNDKHNEANGEENRDGANDNNSWNCGDEGPTDDPDDHRAARAAEAKSDRHPDALAGRADDARRRRAGPQPGGQQQHLLPGQRAHLARLGPGRPAAEVPGVHRKLSSSGGPSRSSSGGSFSSAGRCAARTSRTSPFSALGPGDVDEDWNAGFVKCLGVRLAGDLIDDDDERGEPIVGETLLLLLNGHWEPIPFTLPTTSDGHLWERILDTADPRAESQRPEGGRSTRSRTVRWPCCRPQPRGDGSNGHAAQSGPRRRRRRPRAGRRGPRRSDGHAGTRRATSPSRVRSPPGPDPGNPARPP